MLTHACCKFSFAKDLCVFTQQESLPSLISARDDCRRGLHAAISDFLSTTHQLPLEDKGCQLAAVLQGIQGTYSGFLQPEITDCMPLSEVVPLYSAWRVSSRYWVLTTCGYNLQPKEGLC